MFCRYLRQGHGLCINSLFLFLGTVPAFLLVVFRVLVIHWTNAAPASQMLSSWRVSSGLLAAAIILLAGAVRIFLANTLLTAGKSLHNKMLERVARAPMSFFVSSPVGRILNRFSKDTAMTDNMLTNQILSIVQVSSLPPSLPLSLSLSLPTHPFSNFRWGFPQCFWRSG